MYTTVAVTQCVCVCVSGSLNVCMFWMVEACVCVAEAVNGVCLHGLLLWTYCTFQYCGFLCRKVLFLTSLVIIVAVKVVRKTW